MSKKLRSDVLYLEDVMAALGVSDLEVIGLLASGRLVAPGKIPKELQWGNHLVCWLQSDVDAFLARERT